MTDFSRLNQFTEVAEAYPTVKTTQKAAKADNTWLTEYLEYHHVLKHLTKHNIPNLVNISAL